MLDLICVPQNVKEHEGVKYRKIETSHADLKSIAGIFYYAAGRHLEFRAKILGSTASVWIRFFVKLPEGSVVVSLNFRHVLGRD